MLYVAIEKENTIEFFATYIILLTYFCCFLTIYTMYTKGFSTFILLLYVNFT